MNPKPVEKMNKTFASALKRSQASKYFDSHVMGSTSDRFKNMKRFKMSPPINVPGLIVNVDSQIRKGMQSIDVVDSRKLLRDHSRKVSSSLEESSTTKHNSPLNKHGSTTRLKADMSKTKLRDIVIKEE